MRIKDIQKTVDNNAKETKTIENLTGLWFDDEKIKCILNSYTNEINLYIESCINGKHDIYQKEKITNHIKDAITYWCGNLYPGIKLNNENAVAYSNFFNSLYLLLHNVVVGKIKTSKKIQKECGKYLYTGEIYRFLGTRTPKRNLLFKDVNYDGINVSWTKTPILESVEKEFIGEYFRFNASAGRFSKKAIDLEAMNLCKKGEAEVVYPFSRELINNCTKLEWISVRDEEEGEQ